MTHPLRRRAVARTAHVERPALRPVAFSLIGPALLWYLLNLASAVPV